MFYYFKNYFILIILLTFSFNSLSKELKVKVIWIVDGDTIIVKAKNKKYKIRLLGIDAPEYKQNFGKKATKYLIKKLKNKKVIIEYQTVDDYGRILGTVFLNNININQDLVVKGFAWHYRHSKDKILQQLENQAKQNKRGLWSQTSPKPPWIFRNQSKI